MSEHLTRHQVEELIAAAAYAECIGLPFNRHWTIHYERAGIDDSDGAQFVGHVLRLAGAAARRAGGEMAAVWVRENGDGKGAHVHILMHLPAGTTLRNRTVRWIKAAGGAIRARVSKVRSIGGRLSYASMGNDWEAVEHYQVNASRVLSYLLKYTEADTGEVLELMRRGEAGLVVGKRCGWTQNVGRSSRARGQAQNRKASGRA